MNKLLLIAIAFFCFMNTAFATETDKSRYWDNAYQTLLLQKVGEALPELVTFPFFQYPNKDHEKILSYFPSGKVPIFGYGSLMNKDSAARSIKAEAVETMEPVVAFGVKRIFNYKVNDTSRWGKQDCNRKAMLNIAQTLNISSMANGVVFEVDAEDLTRLVSRETGYDLIPILVASWDDIVNQDSEIKIQVVYTFVAVNELRNNTAYTSTAYYPVLGYMHAVQDASKTYGRDFATFWNRTTYLANGTTPIEGWDEATSKGILCTQKP